MHTVCEFEFQLHHELIANAAHGENVFGLRRNRFEFFAQPADVNVESAFVAVEVFAPDALEQGFARHGFTGVRKQNFQEIKLFERQFDFARAAVVVQAHFVTR